jgi:hypothetical protein
MWGPEHQLPLAELEPETRSTDVCASYSCFEQGQYKLRALDDPAALASVFIAIGLIRAPLIRSCDVVLLVRQRAFQHYLDCVLRPNDALGLHTHYPRLLQSLTIGKRLETGDSAHDLREADAFDHLIAVEDDCLAPVVPKAEVDLADEMPEQGQLLREDLVQCLFVMLLHSLLSIDKLLD